MIWNNLSLFIMFGMEFLTNLNGSQTELETWFLAPWGCLAQLCSCGSVRVSRLETWNLYVFIFGQDILARHVVQDVVMFDPKSSSAYIT